MGRRWGKTVLGGDLALTVASQGGKSAWVVPTFKNGRPLWRWASDAVKPLERAGIVRVLKADRIIEFTYNGGFLSMFSADKDADAMRGDSFDLAVLDEAARMDQEVWTSTIQPTLADRNGDAILISTPNGLNWFWEEFQTGLDNMKTQASWTAPSFDNPNPFIQRAAAAAQGRVPEFIYRQEWLAEFIDSEGTVFRRIREAAYGPGLAGPQRGHQYSAGVDVAASIDYTVISVMDDATKKQVYMDRFTRVDYNVLMDRLEAVYRRWNLRLMKIESNSVGQPVIDGLRKRGMNIISFTTTNASKQLIIQNLQVAFENSQIGIIDDGVQIRELLSFVGKRTPGGMYTYGAQDGMHDDCVMALAIAWDSLRATGLYVAKDK